MAADEDFELRDLLLKTLEKRGVINKMKAELRASVYLALEEQDAIKEHCAPDSTFVRGISTDGGRLAASLVQEFLEFFKLKFTLSVFGPEAPFEALSKAELCERLGLDSAVAEEPVLVQLVTRSDVSSTPRLKDPLKMGGGDESTPGTTPRGNDGTYIAGFARSPREETGSGHELELSKRDVDRSVGVATVSRTPEAADAGKESTLPPLAFLHGPLPPLIAGRPPHMEHSVGVPTQVESQQSLQSTGSSSQTEKTQSGSEVEEELSNMDELLSLSLGEDGTLDQTVSKSSDMDGCDHLENFG